MTLYTCSKPSVLGGVREWGLLFLRSPVEITGSSESGGGVDGVRLNVTRLEV